MKDVNIALLALSDVAELAIAAKILSNAGLRTMLSRSCREALRQLSSGQPQMVLCDKHLPDGDWKDLISWLADSPEPPRVVVLAGNEPEFYAEAINLGAYDVLLRPLDAEELGRVASTACGMVRRPPQKAMAIAAGGCGFPLAAVSEL
jgi:DNA-binding NtrC family response regulator